MLALLLVAGGVLEAQGPENVLVVINDKSALSREIGEYYARRRGIPMNNLCRLRTGTSENIARADYDREIALPIAAFLRRNKLREQILYIATTSGVPLRISGVGPGIGRMVDSAAVDSELTLL
jgi:uncharacterized protein (TIGR03790 family)